MSFLPQNSVFKILPCYGWFTFIGNISLYDYIQNVLVECRVNIAITNHDATGILDISPCALVVEYSLEHISRSGIALSNSMFNLPNRSSKVGVPSHTTISMFKTCFSKFLLIYVIFSFSKQYTSHIAIMF